MHIILQRNEDRRIRDGHLWVFSNEIRELSGAPEGGSLVEVRDAAGRFIAVGFYNPHSLIAVRILSYEDQFRSRTTLDEQFFADRIGRAYDLRKKLFPGSETFRLVHGESDLLPGLVIDKFNDYLSIQTVSLGMDIHLNEICNVLESLFHPAGIIERNDTHLREYEGLAERKGVLRGGAGSTVIDEEGIRYTVDPLEGQKTGFFLDQRENRKAIGKFATGARVLDCFCNEGGFALHAAAAGAREIDAVDISGQALQRANENAALNGAAGTIRFQTADVFRFLDEAVKAGRRYDLIVLDPPSFTKSRKNVPAAKQGYRQLHSLAFGLLNRGGILATASCSHHIFEATFLEVIQQGAQKAGKMIGQLDWKGASPDHPVLPPMQETRYLKFGIFTVM